jgi:hypothetical protein
MRLLGSSGQHRSTHLSAVMVVVSDFVWARPQEISFPNAAPFRAGANGGKVNHFPPL